MERCWGLNQAVSKKNNWRKTDGRKWKCWTTQNWTIPAEVHAAGPADEPVENSFMFHGFLVLPPYQISSYARDPETSFATRTAPAAFNLYRAKSQARKNTTYGILLAESLHFQACLIPLVYPSFNVKNLIFEIFWTPSCFKLGYWNYIFQPIRNSM